MVINCPLTSHVQGVILSPGITLRVWPGNPRKLYFRCICIESTCFGQRKDRPFSSELLLTIDEAEELAGTAKFNAFMINIVLWCIS